MNLILCYQTPYDTVTYITDDILTPNYISYYAFLQFVRPYIKKDYLKFMTNLNRFYNILIDIKKETWKIYRKEFSIPTMEQLIYEQEKKKKKGFLFKRKKVDRIKDYTNDVINRKNNIQDIKPFQFFSNLKRNKMPIILEK